MQPFNSTVNLPHSRTLHQAMWFYQAVVVEDKIILAFKKEIRVHISSGFKLVMMN
jgi:hypothetical protein